MSLVAEILICVALIVMGATGPKPAGSVVLGLGVLALLLVVLGGFPPLWGHAH